jgi:hypothetical protein
MPSASRIESWLRYDGKRSGTAHRRLIERARWHTRTLRKRGRCEYCGRRGSTVWHHPDYRCPHFVDEVCLRCHRAQHPRPVIGGKVR